VIFWHYDPTSQFDASTMNPFTQERSTQDQEPETISEVRQDDVIGSSNERDSPSPSATSSASSSRSSSPTPEAASSYSSSSSASYSGVVAENFYVTHPSWFEDHVIFFILSFVIILLFYSAANEKKNTTRPFRTSGCTETPDANVFRKFLLVVSFELFQSRHDEQLKLTIK